MTGITQEDFRARYDRLPGAPTTELGPMDSPVTGSRRSTGYLEIMLHAYEALRPGHGTNDVAVDGRIARLRSPNVIFSDADAQWLLAALQHRLLLAAEASLVMVHAKLLPFRRLDEYDHSTWATNDSALTEQRARMMTVVKRFPLLLPANAPAYIAQYRVWRKPNQWFSAAAASKGLDQLELHRRLATVQRYRFSGEDAPSSSY